MDLGYDRGVLDAHGQRPAQREAQGIAPGSILREGQGRGRRLDVVRLALVDVERHLAVERAVAVVILDQGVGLPVPSKTVRSLSSVLPAAAKLLDRDLARGGSDEAEEVHVAGDLDRARYLRDGPGRRQHEPLGTGLAVGNVIQVGRHGERKGPGAVALALGLDVVDLAGDHGQRHLAVQGAAAVVIAGQQVACGVKNRQCAVRRAAEGRGLAKHQGARGRRGELVKLDRPGRVEGPGRTAGVQPGKGQRLRTVQRQGERLRGGERQAVVAAAVTVARHLDVVGLAGVDREQDLVAVDSAVVLIVGHLHDLRARAGEGCHRAYRVLPGAGDSRRSIWPVTRAVNLNTSTLDGTPMDPASTAFPAGDSGTTDASAGSLPWSS